MTGRISLALASSSIAQAVQMLFFLQEGAFVTQAFFWSHWLVLLAFYLTVALAAGEMAHRKAWAAAVLWLPVAFAAHRGTSARYGSAGVFLLLLAAGAVLALWCLWRWLGESRPLTAAAAGSVAGAVVARFSTLGGEKSEVAGFMAWPILVVVAAATAVILAGRDKRVSSLSSRGALSLAVGVGAVAIALLPLERSLRAPRPEFRSGRRPPVVFIVLDTLRADHLQMHGYGRNTMPFLEDFARDDGLVAERMVTNGASSLPSHGSLFTGRYPPRHGAHKPGLDDPTPPAYGYPLLDSAPTLAGLLRDAGYWTAAVNANYGTVSEFFGFARGFEYFRVPHMPRATASPWLAVASHPRLRPLQELVERLPPFRQAELFSSVPYVRASGIIDLAVEVVDAAEGEPFFLFVNLLDPHTPYRPPAGFDKRFPGAMTSRAREFLEGEEWLRVLRGDRQLTSEEVEHLGAVYDGELVYLDSELRRLLDRLRHHPRWEEMLVVVTSDHGEALGERRGVTPSGNHLGHSISLYDEIVRVPLVVKPGSSSPDPLLGATVQSVDLFAGILEHAGLPIPAASDGVAWGRERSHAFAWAYVHQAFARAGIAHLARELIAVERDRWKLIRSSSGEIELFDLGRDPAETLNLAAVETVIRDELLAAAESVQATDIHIDRVIETAPEELEKLRDLGYIN